MKILEVKIPNFAKPESSYVVEVILDYILDVPYSLSVHTDSSISFCFGGKSCSFAYHFFKNDVVGDLYIIDNIPNQISEQEFNVAGQSFLMYPIYGSEKIVKEESCLRFDFDLIGSVFFMLSRWEEKMIDSNDVHGRFDPQKALSVKSNFIQFPVVNQYAVFLSAILRDMGLDLTSSSTSYKIEMSHDIDYITKWKSVRSLFGGFRSEGLKLRALLSIWNSYINSKKDKRLDPFFTFDFLLKEYSKRNLRSCFYFKTNQINEGLDKTDYKIDEPSIIEAMLKIKDHGHDIGLHSSYSSFLNQNMIGHEKMLLEKALDINVDRIRQDYLRISLPESMIQFNFLNFSEDSSINYTHYPGFRNGICNRFPLFNFRERKKLKLIELPLVCMMSMGRDLTLDQIEKEFVCFIDMVKKYKGHISLLWHNSDLDNIAKKSSFLRILDKIVA